MFDSNIHLDSHPHTHNRTRVHRGGQTSGEGELNLLVNDLHSDEVVFLIEPAVVEKQSVSLSGSKPAGTEEN